MISGFFICSIGTNQEKNWHSKGKSFKETDPGIDEILFNVRYQENFLDGHRKNGYKRFSLP